jgi:hypothetical protein
MTSQTNGQLDHFETALLAELRSVVEERQQPRRPKRRRYLYAGLVAAAAAGVAVLVVPGIGNQPAYAVTVDGDGEVHVRVHELSDAAGLEKALAAQGIRADVTYLPDDTECAPGRYDQADEHPGDFHLSVGDGYGYRIDMDGGVVAPDETLVISASRITPAGDPDGDGISDEGGSNVSFGVAVGEVGPCVPVPHTEGP